MQIISNISGGPDGYLDNTTYNGGSAAAGAIHTNDDRRQTTDDDDSNNTDDRNDGNGQRYDPHDRQGPEPAMRRQHMGSNPKCLQYNYPLILNSMKFSCGLRARTERHGVHAKPGAVKAEGHPDHSEHCPLCIDPQVPPWYWAVSWSPRLCTAHTRLCKQ